MIPVIIVRGRTLPEAYEDSLIELYHEGLEVKTQYDKEGDKLSIDATANITIEEPESDPMIYRIFPGGIEDLREYVIDLQGAKDHWVRNMNDPEDKRWDYTYSQRLTRWGEWKAFNEKVSIVEPVNQLEIMVEKLVESPFTRRSQAVTWMPFMDNKIYDPPCLQSIWCRITEEDDTLYLNTNIRFRSNDAWGAAYMNMFGLTHLVRISIANPIEEKLGRPVKLGRLNWQADSYHIYGKDIKNFKDRFFKRIATTNFADRVWNFNDPAIQEMWNEATESVKIKIEKYDKEHNYG